MHQVGVQRLKSNGLMGPRFDPDDNLVRSGSRNLSLLEGYTELAFRSERISNEVTFMRASRALSASYLKFGDSARRRRELERQLSS